MIFNDPFDVTSELRLHFDEVELSKALTMEIARKIVAGETSFGHPTMRALHSIIARADPEARANMAAELLAEPPATTPGQIESMEQLREVWRKIVPTMRILCLSERNDITSMWHNYADQFRGVVLEFEAVDELDSAFLVARKVNYQGGPPRIAEVGEWVQCVVANEVSRYLELFTEYEYSKASDWSNECEWRVVSGKRPHESGTFSDYPFSPRELTGVYFGSRIDLEDRSDILALLKYELDHVAAHESVVDVRAGRLRFLRLGR